MYYSSTVDVLLGYMGCITQVQLMYYSVLVVRGDGLVVPVDDWFVAVELEIFGYANLFERFENELLFVWRQRTVAATALEVLVAGPMDYAYRHEIRVLVGVHPLLEIGEAAGVSHGGAVAMVFAGGILGAKGGVDKAQMFVCLHFLDISHLVQTSGCQRAVAMYAYGISSRSGCEIFF